MKCFLYIFYNWFYWRFQKTNIYIEWSMFCIFLQSLAYLDFSLIYLEATLKLYLPVYLSLEFSLFMCYAVCLWNNMYIKLLILKMSGEYLYFSLSASLNIKNVCNIYVICSSQYFKSTFHPVSCSPRYLGPGVWYLLYQFSQNLGKLRDKLTSIWGAHGENTSWNRHLFGKETSFKGPQSLNVEW